MWQNKYVNSFSNTQVLKLPQKKKKKKTNGYVANIYLLCFNEHRKAFLEQVITGVERRHSTAVNWNKSNPKQDSIPSHQLKTANPLNQPKEKHGDFWDMLDVRLIHYNTPGYHAIFKKGISKTSPTQVLESWTEQVFQHPAHIVLIWHL